MTEQMKKIYLEYKQLVWMVVSSLSAIVILVLVIIPEWLSYFKVSNEMVFISKRTSNLEAKAAELDKINETQVQKDLKTVYTILPAEPNVPTSFNLLQAVIRQSDLSLKSINYSFPKGAESNANNYKLIIVVVGKLDQLDSFLNNLKKAPQLFQVESISSSTGFNGIETELPITVFYEPFKTIQGSIDQPVAKLTDKEQEVLNQFSVLVDSSGFSQEDLSDIQLGKLNPFE